MSIELVPFVGTYDHKVYPTSYTESEKQLLGMNETRPWYDRLVIETTVRDFRGIPCLAGFSNLYITETGTIQRCLYDNLLLKSPFTTPRPCRVGNCGCGLLLEELNSQDRSFWEYWYSVAKRQLPEVFGKESHKDAEALFQERRCKYLELMERYGKTSTSLHEEVSKPDSPKQYIILYDYEGTDLIDHLEKNFYAHGGKVELVRSGSLGIVFQPSTPRDHLTTPFVSLTKTGRSRPLSIRLTFLQRGKPNEKCSVYLQDDGFNKVSSSIRFPGETGVFFANVEIPSGLTPIRLVIEACDRKPTFVPFAVKIEQETPL